jgi:hypothetical protein
VQACVFQGIIYVVQRVTVAVQVLTLTAAPQWITYAFWVDDDKSYHDYDELDADEQVVGRSRHAGCFVRRILQAHLLPCGGAMSAHEACS